MLQDIKDLGIDEILLKDMRDLYTEVRYPSNIGFLADGTLPTQEKAKIYLDFTKNVASIIKNEIKNT
jgi:hypothetical protein